MPIENKIPRDRMIVEKANNLIYALSRYRGQPMSISDIRRMRGYNEDEINDFDLHHILHILDSLGYIIYDEDQDIIQMDKAAKSNYSKFVKTSQMPPPPSMPPPAGGAEMPPLPMGAPMGAPTPPEKPVIPGPLDSIDKIFVDSDAMDKLKSPQDLKQITIDIWEQYGGLSDGDINRQAVGKRQEKDEDRDVLTVKKANKIDEDRKWERLPIGKTIADIVGSLSDFENELKKLLPSVVKELKGGAGAGAAPPGGAPPGGMLPMAGSRGIMLRMASAVSGLRREGMKVHADYVEKLILKYMNELE